MIYSYNKNQRDALISQIYFGIKLHVFRTGLLSIIRSLVLYPVIQVMLSASITSMKNTYCYVYNTRVLIMDSKPVRNM
jgi:hypothetical protein